jgi:hypothetical protein
MSDLSARVAQAEEVLKQTGDVPREVLNLYLRSVRTILNQETGERREEVIEVPPEDWILRNEFDAKDVYGRPVHWRVWKPRPESESPP